MDYKEDFSPMSRDIMVGLLSGLIGTFACLIYVITFFAITGFSLFGVMNIGLITYGAIFPVASGALIYYLLERLRLGTVIYFILFLGISFFVVQKGLDTNAIGYPGQEKQFHQLIVGTIVIICFCATFLVPILIRYKKLTSFII